MLRRSSLYPLLYLGLVAGLAAGTAKAAVIDIFNYPQSVSTQTNAPAISTISLLPGSLAASRTLTVYGLGNPPHVSGGVANFSAGFSETNSASTLGSIKWTFAAPFDITEGGTMHAIAFDVMSVSPTAWTATLDLGDATGPTASAVTIPVPGAGHYVVPLSAFAPAIDQTAITSLSLVFNLGSFAASAQISLGEPVQTVPEPGLWLAWATLCLLAGPRLANALRGVGRFGRERAVAARAGRGRRDRRDGVLQAG